MSSSWRSLPEKWKGSDIHLKQGLGEEELVSTDSWVELAPPSRGSLCSSVDAYLLTDAQQPTKGGSHNSPKSLQSPNVELEDLEAVKYKLTRDMLPPGKGTDWIWDWSSRPEAVPPKEYRFRHPGSSALTTPPNSPVPSPGEVASSLSLRHSRLLKSQSLSPEVLIGFVVSNLLTLLLGACIGYYIGKRGQEEPCP
jgi:BCL2/adenovirus E1B protein-interacting protein 3